MNTIPNAGWRDGFNGNVEYVLHGSSIMVDPPKREGFTVFFIGRNEAYTVWTYKPVQTESK